MRATRSGKVKRLIANKLSYLRGKIQSWKGAESAVNLASMREDELTEEQLRKVFGGKEFKWDIPGNIEL